RVYVVTYHQEGTVTALADKSGQVQVQAGIMRAKVAQTELRLLENVPKPKQMKPSEGKVKTAVARTCKMELDVRGEYAEDAWEKVDRYIDDALLSGLAEARIIHGKGTGKLRVHIQNRLRTDRRIKSYRNGSYGEGDMGVTVIVLK
ncbi:MAG: Smr/MutS family protein, partial [Clostridia bacterium]|nr:Smr/MutS family protein [Clostridia bacterium]